MSRLHVYMMFEGGVSLTEIMHPRWDIMSKNNETVYFVPEPAVHEFVGELFLKNIPINFIPFNDVTVLPRKKTVFFLVRHRPEGLWDRDTDTRYAEPAKGTGVV